jgi:DNA-binding MurR/RpiR family transcriptional regulator
VAQASLVAQLRRPTDRIRHGSRADAARHRTWEEATTVAVGGVERVFSDTSHDDIVRLVEPLAACSGSIWVLGSDTSSAARQVLASGMHMLRPGVRHLRGSRAEIAVDVADARADDVAVVIDFPRYERTVVDTARSLSDLGVTTIAVTDGPLSPLATIADHWCEVAVGAIGPFDSALPAVALVEIMLAELADRLREPATARFDRTEALWEANDVFLRNPPNS